MFKNKYTLIVFSLVMIIPFSGLNSVSAQSGNPKAAQIEDAIRKNQEVNDKIRLINTEIQTTKSKLATAQNTVVKANVTVDEVMQRQAELDVTIEKITEDLKGKAVNSYVGDSENSSNTDDSNPVIQELRAEWILGTVIKNESELLAELEIAKDEKRIAEDIRQTALENKEFAITSKAKLLLKLETEKKQLQEIEKEIQPLLDVIRKGKMLKVRNFIVHPSIAADVLEMVDAARADGLNLGGGGFRTAQQQIALRKAHCGTSNYAIYRKPSSSCNPPTATPGNSQHESGLALDLTCNGALIEKRSNACFKWLDANASKYGLKNLPSEPWHWSTTGR